MEEMDCRKFIQEENVREILVDYDIETQIEKLKDIPYCYQKVDRNMGVLYVDGAYTRPLSLSSYRYSYIPKCYALMQLKGQSLKPFDQSFDSRGMDSASSQNINLAAYAKAGILRVQSSPLSLSGEGVLIGIVDSGIRAQLPIFKDENGSRIYSIWDQTQDVGNPPEGFLYGREYTKGEIDDLSMDEDGHGTALASIAVTAAPSAKLVIVKCRKAKKDLLNYYGLSENAQAYSEADLLTGYAYLEHISKKTNRPLVICITMGTNMGDHAAHSLLATYLEMLGTFSGHVLVACGGNEGNAFHHYQGNISLPVSEGTGQVGTAYEDVEIRVDSSLSGFCFEIWGNIPAIFTISLRSPDGENTGIIPPKVGSEQQYSFVFNDTKVGVNTILVERSSGTQLIFVRMKNPLEGIWTLRVYARGSTDQAEFNIWLPVREFVDDKVDFLKPDPFTTLTEPAYLENGINLSYYNSDNNSFAIDSGRGYQRLGLIDPDICAPGINVGTILGTRSGASVSCALTAGACAQFLEWAIVRGRDELISSSGVRNYFVRGADRETYLSYPNPIWGYGRLDIAGVFEALVGV